MNKEEAIRQHLLSIPSLTAIVEQRIYKNQGNQEDYDSDYIVLAFKEMPNGCRIKSVHSEIGELTLFVYTYNYDNMTTIRQLLKTHLSDVGFVYAGYRYDLERLQEEMDNVTNETKGLTIKEFNIIYHQNLA